MIFLMYNQHKPSSRGHLFHLYIPLNEISSHLFLMPFKEFWYQLQASLHSKKSFIYLYVSKYLKFSVSMNGYLFIFF